MPLSPRAAEAHTGPALRNAPGDAALSRHTPAGTLQVAAYDSFAILRPTPRVGSTHGRLSRLPWPLYTAATPWLSHCPSSVQEPAGAGVSWRAAAQSCDSNSR